MKTVDKEISEEVLERIERTKRLLFYDKISLQLQTDHSFRDQIFEDLATDIYLQGKLDTFKTLMLKHQEK
jgi:hypothetical protein